MRLASLSKCLILIASASFLLGASSCKVGGNAPDFNWNPELWLGDHDTQSIIRKDDHGDIQQILTSDRRFSSMIVLKASEIPKAKRAAQELVNACEKWKTNGKATADAVVESLDAINAEVQQFSIPESE